MNAQEIAAKLTKAQREALPKAALFWVRWMGRTGIRRLFLRSRCANAMVVFAGPVQVGWRMPWLPDAARALHPEVFAVRQIIRSKPND
jgi:hypothetical protein